jgi:hypothetical protein
MKTSCDKFGLTKGDQMKKERIKPKRIAVPINVWQCTDLKDLIKETIEVHVRDVELAKKLEHALGDEIAYGDGGGDPVATT